MKKRFLYLLSILLITSCASESTKQEAPIIFKYNEVTGITSLDPADASNYKNIWAVNHLYNGLVEMNDSLHIVPSIAKSWEISADGLTYIFHLNNTVLFHDHELFAGGKGRKVSAGDFVYSFNRLLDTKISAAYTLLTNVDNKNKKGFEAPDDSTFIIHLSKPFTPFLGILTMKYFSVIPKEIETHYMEDFRKNPIGTGPFKFKTWEEGSKLIFVKNPTYFEFEGNERLPYLDVVSISFIKDREASFLDFLQGNLDMVSGIEVINKDEVLTDDGTLKDEFKGRFILDVQPSLKTDYIELIGEDSPMKNKAIRQAISYGIDRKKMVQFLRKNIGKAASSGFVPPGFPSFDESKVKGYDYDPEKVKELLFLAGYPEGKGLPEILLYTTESYLDISEYIQSKLSEFGIKIKIEVQKTSVSNENAGIAAINFWIADYPDAENFLSLFYSKNRSADGYSFTHYYNPQFDILYEKSQAELNDSIRYDHYRQMDQLLMDDLPLIPLYYDEVIRLVQNNISGLNSNSINVLSLKKVKKSQ
ncbi:MAG: ABC transporter substrate-binding protein [Bacteroidota bacterium]